MVIAYSPYLSLLTVLIVLTYNPYLKSLLKVLTYGSYSPYLKSLIIITYSHYL